ncbi:hypothetical protein ACOJTA_05635 [Malaciobacter sp. WC5094]
MYLKEFIENEIKNGFYEYKIKQSDNGYIIFEQSDMNKDYEIQTYFFKNNKLSFKSVLHCDTNELEYIYYSDNRVKYTHWFFHHQPSSFSEYDEEGNRLNRVEFSFN